VTFFVIATSSCVNYLARMPSLPGVVRLSALGLTLGLVASCGATGSPTEGSHTKTSTPTAQPSHAPSYVVARIALGTKPCGIVVAGQRVWVSNYGDGTLQSIDRGTRVASEPIEVGTGPCGVAVGGGSVWVENYGSDDVTRVDEDSGRVIATVKVGASPYDVAYAAGAAWVTDFAEGTVSRIDARTNKRRVITTGGQPAGIAAVGGAVWVALSDSGNVLRIDEHTSKVTDTIRAGLSAVWTAYAGDSLWVTGTSIRGVIGTVTRINTRSRRAVATIKVGPKPADGVVVGGAVYVPDQTGDIYRIDAATNTVTAKVPSGVDNPFVITGDRDELWAANFAGTEAVRIDLNRLVQSSR
jgi:YVTN family beta-propeller protein